MNRPKKRVINTKRKVTINVRRDIWELAKEESEVSGQLPGPILRDAAELGMVPLLRKRRMARNKREARIAELKREGQAERAAMRPLRVNKNGGEA